MVHLLRDTRKVLGFFADMAEGRVFHRASQCLLRRNDVEFAIGNASEGLTEDQALENFQNVVRQVALLEIALDGKPIPPRVGVWLAMPEQAVNAVESNALIGLATSSPRWAAWQDAIRGLILE